MAIALVGGLLLVLALVCVLVYASRRPAPGRDAAAARRATPPPPAPPIRTAPARPVNAPARTVTAPTAPTPRAAATPSGPTTPAGSSHDSHGPLVLIVDDSPVMRRALAALFGKAGYRTASAADGSEAVSWVRGNGMPSLITLDMEMPGMDGRQTLDALQGLGGGRGVRAVFVTNKVQSEEARATARQGGAVGFFSKPYDPAELLALASQIAPLAPVRGLVAS